MGQKRKFLTVIISLFSQTGNEYPYVNKVNILNNYHKTANRNGNKDNFLFYLYDDLINGIESYNITNLITDVKLYEISFLKTPGNTLLNRKFISYSYPYNYIVFKTIENIFLTFTGLRILRYIITLPLSSI